MLVNESPDQNRWLRNEDVLNSIITSMVSSVQDLTAKTTVHPCACHGWEVEGSLFEFAAHLHESMHLSFIEWATARAYVRRLEQPTKDSIPCADYRILLVLMILSHKFHRDECYTLTSWQEIASSGHIHLSLRSIALAERQLLERLNWSLTVTEADISTELLSLLSSTPT